MSTTSMEAFHLVEQIRHEFDQINKNQTVTVENRTTLYKKMIAWRDSLLASYQSVQKEMSENFEDLLDETSILLKDIYDFTMQKLFVNLEKPERATD